MITLVWHFLDSSLAKHGPFKTDKFNLGELLILKNWILYAIAMDDSEAIAKYGHINYDNKTISKAIELKRSLAL